MAHTHSSRRATESMMRRTLLRKSFALLATMLVVLFVGGIAGFAMGQTTGFTYQGSLTDGGTTANGNYDLQFVLFDSAAGGNQIGTTQTLNTVAVSGGIFTVTLDFGASAFPGGNRFLEISARRDTHRENCEHDYELPD